MKFRPPIFALISPLLLLNGGCEKKEPVKYIQVEDQEIIILKNGKEIASVIPNSGRSKATILSSTGNSSFSIYISRSGIDSEVELMHRKVTGETVFLTMKNDGGDLFSDDQFQWIEDAMFRYANERQKKAEQGGAGQPATRPESKSEGGDKPQPEAEGRSR